MASIVRQISLLIGGKKSVGSLQNTQNSQNSTISVNKPWLCPFTVSDNINDSNTELEEETREHLESTWPDGPIRSLEIRREMEKQVKDITATYGDVIELGISIWVRENVLMHPLDSTELVSRMVKNAVYTKRLSRLKEQQFSTIPDEKWKDLRTFEELYDEVLMQAWIEDNHTNSSYMGPCKNMACVLDNITDIDTLSELYERLQLSFNTDREADEKWKARRLQSSDEIKFLINQSIMTATGDPTIVTSTSRKELLDRISDRMKSIMANKHSSRHVNQLTRSSHISRPLSDASTITDDDRTLVDDASETKSVKSVKSYKSFESTSSTETIKCNRATTPKAVDKAGDTGRRVLYRVSNFGDENDSDTQVQDESHDHRRERSYWHLFRREDMNRQWI